MLDEREIAANTDLCCNHAFGRAARELAWHTGAHGVKYTVYSTKRLADRIIWGLIVAVAFIIGLVLSVLLVVAYHEEPVFVAIDKVEFHAVLSQFSL